MKQKKSAFYSIHATMLVFFLGGISASAAEDCEELNAVLGKANDSVIRNFSDREEDKKDKEKLAFFCNPKTSLTLDKNNTEYECSATSLQLNTGFLKQNKEPPRDFFALRDAILLKPVKNFGIGMMTLPRSAIKKNSVNEQPIAVFEIGQGHAFTSRFWLPANESKKSQGLAGLTWQGQGFIEKYGPFGLWVPHQHAKGAMTMGFFYDSSQKAKPSGFSDEENELEVGFVYDFTVNRTYTTTNKQTTAIGQSAALRMEVNPNEKKHLAAEVDQNGGVMLDVYWHPLVFYKNTRDDRAGYPKRALRDGIGISLIPNGSLALGVDEKGSPFIQTRSRNIPLPMGIRGQATSRFTKDKELMIGDLEVHLQKVLMRDKKRNLDLALEVTYQGQEPGVRSGSDTTIGIRIFNSKSKKKKK